MRLPSMDTLQKEEMLSKCFNYFVEYGLEGVTMRNLCDQTGIAVSSAYYWFGNKDNMLIQATEWLIHIYVAFRCLERGNICSTRIK